MKFLLSAFLLLLSIATGAQINTVRPTLTPWSTIGVSDRMAFSHDGQYLLFTADGQVMIYDLKKRAMLAAIPDVAEGVLEVDPKQPYFYTWNKIATPGIQKRSLPLGRVVETTTIPKEYKVQSDLVIEPDSESDILCTAVELDHGRGVLQLKSSGAALGVVAGLPGGEKVNAICRRAGRLWALTSHGLWRQRDSVFEMVALPGEANYANARFNADTLVIIGQTLITWYDTRNRRTVRQTPIPGFFVREATDNKASLLSFHHPFAIDNSGKVWLTDTRRIYDAKDLNYPPYALALVGDVIEYPFRSAEQSTNAVKYMGEQIAYHPGHRLLAAAGWLDEIELLDPAHGSLFSISRKSLELEGLRFTSKPGRILLRVSALRSEPALLIDLGNGRLETIATVDDRLMIPGNAVFTEAQPAGPTERLYRSNTGQWVEQPYLRYNGEAPLLYNSEENKLLHLPAKRRVTISETGVLAYRDSAGKVLRSVQLSPLDRELYGLVDDKEYRLNKNLKISFTGRNYIERTQYDSSSGLLYVKIMDRYSSSEGTLTVIDLQKGSVVFQNTGTDLLLLPGGKTFLTDEGIFDLRTLKTVHFFGTQSSLRASHFALSRDGRKVFALVWRGYKQPYSLDLEKKMWTELSPFPADELMIDPHADRVFALSKDKGIAIWDAQTGTPLAQIVFSGNRNNQKLNQLDPSYLVLLPDGYYMGQNKYYQLLQLQQEGKPIGLSQMDGVFHRPDKVLRALGYASPSSIGLLEKIAERRSSRFSGRFPTVDASIEGLAKLPYYQEGNRLSLTVNIPVATGNSGLMAYANGTALYQKPLPIAGKTSIPVEVALVDANTHLRVCLVDAKGKETPGDYYYLQGKAVEDRELYVLGIGVSEFRDARYNLKYAAKDMNDLTAFLKTTSSYRKVHVASWQDSEVTPALADSLRKTLLAARPQDVVLCYFAGHGLLDKANNYFLATYEQDFADPARGGLSIETISDALSTGDARKKLLIIDACHSGLVEDLVSAASAAAADTSGQSSVVKRGIQAPGGGAKASDLYFSFQHFGQGSGLDILAASAGNEYALELGALKNGVFTYSLLQALKTGAADNNADKKITLGELQRYVAASTVRLTKGAQQPTFRQANLYQDIALFSAGDTYLERLMKAARRDDTEEIQSMLATGAFDLKQVDQNGFTPLHYAARQGSFGAAQLLIRAGADLKARTPINATPLYLAAYNNHYRVAYLLLASGASVSEFPDWQLTELDKRTDAPMKDLLLHFPSIREEQGRYYSLAKALSAGAVAKADSLLRGSKWELDRPLIIEGIPVLFSPVYDDQVAAARWLIEQGASPDGRSNPHRWTPLMVAAFRGNEAMVKMLLEKGASKTAQDSGGRTAADYARQSGKTSLLPLLTN